MQKHSNVWELLGQFSLACCLDRHLRGCHPVTATFACDNTSAEAAHLKALSTSAGMCHVLSAFFVSNVFTTWIFRYNISLVLPKVLQNSIHPLILPDDSRARACSQENTGKASDCDL